MEHIHHQEVIALYRLSHHHLAFVHHLAVLHPLISVLAQIRVVRYTH